VNRTMISDPRETSISGPDTARCSCTSCSLSIDRVADELGIEIDEVSVLETKHLARAGVRKGASIAGRKGVTSGRSAISDGSIVPRQASAPLASRRSRARHGPSRPGPRGSQREFQQIRRKRPGTRRLAAHDDAPVRLAHAPAALGEMRMLNLSKSIARSVTRPFFTAPSLISESICGVAAHAMYVPVGGRPERNTTGVNREWPSGDGHRERAGRTGELDASRHSIDPGRGDELDAIQIVTGAERGGRVARSRPPQSLPCTNPRRAGEDTSASRPWQSEDAPRLTSTSSRGRCRTAQRRIRQHIERIAPVSPPALVPMRMS